jgi:hypothetical protein
MHVQVASRICTNHVHVLLLTAVHRESGVTSMAGSNGTAAAPAGVGGQPDTHEDKKPRTDAAATAAAMEVAAAALAPAAAGATGAAATAAPVSLRPYAVVDEVAEGSPAAAAGIQLGDQLCRWVHLSHPVLLPGKGGREVCGTDSVLGPRPFS